MKHYPEVIGLDVIIKNAHITDAQLEQDIGDTKNEIWRLNELQAAERVIAYHSLSDSERRLAAFKAEARTGEIRDREAFVAFLQRLRAARVELERTTPNGGGLTTGDMNAHARDA